MGGRRQGGDTIVAYTLTADRIASDITGGGSTEVDAADTVNTGAYTYTQDSAWTKNKQSTVYLASQGAFIVEAGVNCEWDDGASQGYMVKVAAGGGYSSYVEVQGTAGAGVTWTVKSGDTMGLLMANGTYGIVGKFSHLTCSVNTYQHIHSRASSDLRFYNCTLQNLQSGSTNHIINSQYGGVYYFEGCALSMPNATSERGCFGSYTSGAMHVTLVDTTYTSNSGSPYILYGYAGADTSIPTRFTIAGVCTVNGSPINPSTHIQTYPTTTPHTFDYYSRVKTTVTNGTNQLVSIGKTDGTEGHVMYRRCATATYPDGGQCLSNINYAYVQVKRWACDGANVPSAWTYYSDEDNGGSEYTVGAVDTAGTRYETTAAQTFYGTATGTTYNTEVELGITLSAPSASDLAININDFTSDGTNDQYLFPPGSTITIGTASAGGVTANANTTGAAVVAEIYDTDDNIQGAALIDDTFDLAQDTEKTFYSMNSDALLTKSGLPTGSYYLKVTVSGGTPTVETTTSKMGFVITSKSMIPNLGAGNIIGGQHIGGMR